MTDLDYTPSIDGIPVDPAAAGVGGSVEKLLLFAASDRSGAPVAEVGPAVRTGPFSYRFTVPSSLTGRFYPRVLWTPSATAAQLIDDMPYVDLPTRSDMVISPEVLAVKLGMTLPISAAHREMLSEIILDSQDQVVAYLGRPIIAHVHTERKLYPVPGGWRLAQTPVIEVISETAEVDSAGRETGYWTVVYRAGLDVRGDDVYRPIRQVLIANALEHRDSQRLWKTVGSGAGGADRQVKSLGAEGQSVSYTYLSAGGSAVETSRADGVVGGPVRWSTIDTWRVRGRRVFTRKDRTGAVDTFVRVL